jgi:hypothetical protein
VIPCVLDVFAVGEFRLRPPPTQATSNPDVPGSNQPLTVAVFALLLNFREIGSPRSLTEVHHMSHANHLLPARHCEVWRDELPNHERAG